MKEYVWYCPAIDSLIVRTEGSDFPVYQNAIIFYKGKDFEVSLDVFLLGEL